MFLGERLIVEHRANAVKAAAQDPQLGRGRLDLKAAKRRAVLRGLCQHPLATLGLLVEHALEAVRVDLFERGEDDAIKDARDSDRRRERALRHIRRHARLLGADGLFDRVRAEQARRANVDVVSTAAGREVKNGGVRKGDAGVPGARDQRLNRQLQRGEARFGGRNVLNHKISPEGGLRGPSGEGESPAGDTRPAADRAAAGPTWIGKDGPELITVPRPGHAAVNHHGLCTYRTESVSLDVWQRPGAPFLELRIGDRRGEIVLTAEAASHLIALLSKAAPASAEAS